MPLSASKSTSKREISASAAKQLPSVDSRKKNPLQRSKSVSAVTRSYTETPVAPAGGDPSLAQFLNKRDNPLFCCSSPSSSEHEGGGVGCNIRRGRSVSRSFGYGNRASESRNQSTRSLSRVGSEGRQRAISRVHYDHSERDEDGECKDILSLKSETKDTLDPKFQKNKGMASNSYGMLEQRKTMQTWRSPVSDYCNTSSSRSWDDGISVSSLSELEETTISEHDHPSTRAAVGCIYDIVRSEVQWAVSEMKNDLENTIWRKNLMEVRSENQETLELVSDIRMEYKAMLKESHERARKLRSDLAIEEQREQEINRMLKEIISDENSAPRKSRPRKKLSSERIEMSRRLAEDAMSYFDECVSISTFDSSDFSSTEDQQPSSVSIIPPSCDNRSLTSDISTYETSCNLNGHFNHPEVEIQTQHAASSAGSNLAAIKSKDMMSLPNGQKHGKLSNLGQFLAGSIKVQSVCDSDESLDFRTCIKRFEKESNKSAKNTEVSSSFNICDYDLDNSAESLLLDVLAFKNRIESGSLLLCDFRTFQ